MGLNDGGVMLEDGERARSGYWRRGGVFFYTRKGERLICRSELGYCERQFGEEKGDRCVVGSS